MSAAPGERREMPAGGDSYLAGAIERATKAMDEVIERTEGVIRAGWVTDQARVAAVPSLIADLRAALGTSAVAIEELVAALTAAEKELAEWREKWSDQNDRMIVARDDRESAEARADSLATQLEKAEQERDEWVKQANDYRASLERIADGGWTFNRVLHPAIEMAQAALDLTDPATLTDKDSDG